MYTYTPTVALQIDSNQFNNFSSNKPKPMMIPDFIFEFPSSGKYREDCTKSYKPSHRGYPNVGRYGVGRRLMGYVDNLQLTENPNFPNSQSINNLFKKDNLTINNLKQFRDKFNLEYEE